MSSLGSYQNWTSNPAYTLNACYQDEPEHFPILQRLAKTPQSARHHPEGNVLSHTSQVCEQMEAYLRFNTTFTKNQKRALMLAAVTHDFGKPETTTISEIDIISHGHEQAGVPLAQEFLNSILAPKNVIEMVLPLVANHLAWANCPLQRRPVYRLIRRIEPATIEMLRYLVRADASGRYPAPPADPMKQLYDYATQLIAADENKPSPWVKANDLMPFGVNGPELGRLLTLAFVAQQDSRFRDKEEGIEWIMERRSKVVINNKNRSCFIEGDSIEA